MNSPIIKKIVTKLWKLKAGMTAEESNNLLTNCNDPVCEDIANYLNLLPEFDIYINGVRFMCHTSIIQENADLIPGCCIKPFGFLVFASLDSGEVFAAEISSGMVYLIPTEKYESPDMISPGWNEAHTDFLPDVPISVQSIKETSSASFDSMKQFLLTSLEDHRR